MDGQDERAEDQGHVRARASEPPIDPGSDAFGTRQLARLLRIAPQSLNAAYRRAVDRQGVALDGRDAERAAALLDVDQATPGGHRRWSRKAAARILRAFGRSVPTNWIV